LVLGYGLGSKAPVTNVGNLDLSSTRTADMISYGAGGMYPAVKQAPRDDGLVLRLIDTPNLGGTGHSFVSVGIAGSGLTLVPGVSGHIWLPLIPLLYVGSFAINDDGSGVGVGKVPIISPGKIPASPGITLGFTTVTLNASYANPRISNAQGVAF